MSGDYVQEKIGITPEAFDAGVRSIMEFFPFAWGSETHGISKEEASLLAADFMAAIGVQTLTRGPANSRASFLESAMRNQLKRYIIAWMDRIAYRLIQEPTSARDPHTRSTAT